EGPPSGRRPWRRSNARTGAGRGGAAHRVRAHRRAAPDRDRNVGPDPPGRGLLGRGDGDPGTAAGRRRLRAGGAPVAAPVDGAGAGGDPPGGARRAPQAPPARARARDPGGDRGSAPPAPPPRAGAGRRQHRGLQRGDDAGVQVHRPRGGQRRHRAGAGRERDGEGDGGARAPFALAPGQGAVRRHQLRRHPGEPAGERAVRARERRVHRRHRPPYRALRTGQRRYTLPGRDRRHVAGAAEQDPARHPGAGGGAGGRGLAGVHRRAHRGGHQPRPGRVGARGALPRGPVLPPGGGHPQPPPAARPGARPGPARAPLRRSLRARACPAGARGGRRGVRGAARPPVAGERAAASQRDGARRGDVGGRGAPPAAPPGGHPAPAGLAPRRRGVGRDAAGDAGRDGAPHDPPRPGRDGQQPDDGGGTAGDPPEHAAAEDRGVPAGGGDV
ncbi:MAG: Signal-transduction regulatory protein FlgR, partial [uncultured Gemmatimonadetes bacterium]